MLRQRLKTAARRAVPISLLLFSVYFASLMAAPGAATAAEASATTAAVNSTENVAENGAASPLNQTVLVAKKESGKKKDGSKKKKKKKTLKARTGTSPLGCAADAVETSISSRNGSPMAAPPIPRSMVRRLRSFFFMGTVLNIGFGS